MDHDDLKTTRLVDYIVRQREESGLILNSGRRLFSKVREILKRPEPEITDETLSATHWRNGFRACNTSSDKSKGY